MKKQSVTARILSWLLAFAVIITTMFSNAVMPVMASEGSEKTEGASAVKVYLSISEDGKFVTGNDDDSTVMYRVPITVEYFDLADYGLEDYYRYEANSFEDGGKYKNDTVVEQPTVLHLYIKAIEQFYLNGETLENNTDAFTCSGSATSLYMTSFWGHDCNLMYFVDHAYPLMAANWGGNCRLYFAEGWYGNRYCHVYKLELLFLWCFCKI